MNELLEDLRKRLIDSAQDWKMLAGDPHNINTAVYVALQEVGTALAATLTANRQSRGIMSVKCNDVTVSQMLRAGCSLEDIIVALIKEKQDLVQKCARYELMTNPKVQS